MSDSEERANAVGSQITRHSPLRDLLTHALVQSKFANGRARISYKTQVEFGSAIVSIREEFCLDDLNLPSSSLYFMCTNA